ncbi:YraN family protein [Vandammella animalimorsus]|uniref:YraN family protein n=1 Tax=Vandammella animalimorsus TaxID=2029117 RepID=UPI0031BB907C
MRFLKTIAGKLGQGRSAPSVAQAGIVAPLRQRIGQAGEARALAYLQAQGLQLVQRNWRAPGRGGGEIDLIVREPDGTLVFVEVRVRGRQSHGGAAASIDARKRRRIVAAARHYLAQHSGVSWPGCRFDVMLVDGEGPQAEMQWLQAAFDADEGS